MSLTLACLLIATSAMGFQSAPAPDVADPDAIPPLPEVDMKPTDLGVRFTPGMAKAISSQFVRQMKPRYELTDEQAHAIDDIMTRQMMRLAQEAQGAGRDTIELMMETMIANDGSFPKESAEKFGKTIKPLFPHLERFFTDTAKQIGAQMSFRQRLKFTTDAAPVVAGLALFKGRMEKWEKGQVGRNANPFFDRDDGPAASQETNVDPDEPAEVTRARRQADQTIQWQIDQRQDRWKEYVDHAIAYYEFDEQQQKSARAILKDSVDRAAAVKTAAWREKMRENRFKLFLSYQSSARLSDGPWGFHIESEYEQMMKPIGELFTDLKRRIDSLPTSAQRVAAEARARQQFEKVGAKVTRT